jgi:hypothetical protein
MMPAGQGKAHANGAVHLAVAVLPSPLKDSQATAHNGTVFEKAHWHTPTCESFVN